MQPRHRLDYVDGLRGFAALVVVIQHASQMVQDAGVNYYRPILDNINLGRFGVVLFFLISGLVIPFSFRGERPLHDFAVSRFFRLYPVYWLSIPVGCSLIVMHGSSVSLGTVLANLTMLQGLANIGNIGAGYWTLTYEAAFYIMCAVLFWRGRLYHVATIGICVLACLAVAVMTLALGFWLDRDVVLTARPYFVGMFFLGLLLRHAFIDGCPQATRWAIVVVPLAMIVATVTSGWIVPTQENFNVYLSQWPLTTSMVLPILVFIVVLWRKPVPGKLVTYLAAISYSLYLFQDVGLLLLPRVLPPGQWPIGYVLGVIGLTVAIASFTHRFVERPMIELGRAIIRRRRIVPSDSVPI